MHEVPCRVWGSAVLYEVVRDVLKIQCGERVVLVTLREQKYYADKLHVTVAGRLPSVSTSAEMVYGDV